MSAQFYEESETLYRLSVREFHDSASPTGKAWIIDLLSPDGGKIVIETAGAADTLPAAMQEAGGEIAYLLSQEWGVSVA